jgi:hypothetical protein
MSAILAVHQGLGNMPSAVGGLTMQQLANQVAAQARGGISPITAVDAEAPRGLLTAGMNPDGSTAASCGPTLMPVTETGSGYLTGTARRPAFAVISNQTSGGIRTGLKTLPEKLLPKPSFPAAAAILNLLSLGS